jgi:type III secretion protein L
MEGRMYCFKLIKEGSVHSADQKIIPKSDFETLITSKELLEKAEAQVKSMIEDAHKECEEIKEKAKLEGFDRGLSKFNEELLIFEEKLKMLRHEMQKAILPLVMKATKKIIGEELKLDSETILSIVLQSIKSISQCKVVKLYVNKKDLDFLGSEKEELKKQFEKLESFQILPREDVDHGGCIIETEKGILNATLENQYRALERALEAHMKPR